MKELQNTDPAIHNYLLSLYALEEKNDDLMNFLDYFKEDYVYDVKYALRVCIQEGKTQACVYIYTLLHLYEEAVKLALKVDLELAKYCADKAEDDETRKKLWLIIARYLIEVGVNSGPRQLDQLATCGKPHSTKNTGMVPLFSHGSSQSPRSWRGTQFR